MLFTEMVQGLLNGKQMVRTGWEVKDGYLVYLPGMLSVWKILTQPNPNAGNHLFTVEEFLANDWKVAEHKNTQTEEEVSLECEAA